MKTIGIVHAAASFRVDGLARLHPLAAACCLAFASLALESCGHENRTPVAVAGANSTSIAEGQLAQLLATASSDEDGDTLTFHWRQTRGPTVALSDPNGPTPTFTVPAVGHTLTDYEFALTVTDGSASSRTSIVLEAHPLNFIVIVTDDQTAASADVMLTLQQRIVAQGSRYTNAFVTTPLCCPSRGSLLTGRYAHNHGALTNFEPRGGAAHFDDSQTIATWLRDAGYRTGLFGKYLNGYDTLIPHEPPGWGRWVAYGSAELQYYDYDLFEDGVLEHYGHDPADYVTDVLASKVLEFLDDVADDPFLIWFTPIAPHSQNVPGSPYVPAERHLGLLEDTPLPKPPNWFEADVADKPNWVRKLDPTPREPDYPRYLETLLAVDEALDAILDELEVLGISNRTVIVFASDNGLSRGEHRWLQKRAAYEEDIRVPLAIKFPPAQSPSVVDAPFLNIDLAPTIAELADVQPGRPVDGLSYASALRSGVYPSSRTSFLIENYAEPGDTPSEYFGVRTTDMKYVEYMGGETELYDLTNDPFELDNATGQSDFAQMRADLAQRVQTLREAGTGFEPLRVTTSSTLALPPQQADYVITLRATGGLPPYQWLEPFWTPIPAGARLDPDGKLTVPVSLFLDENGDPSRTVSLGVRVEDSRAVWNFSPLTLSVSP